MCCQIRLMPTLLNMPDANITKSVWCQYCQIWLKLTLSNTVDASIGNKGEEIEKTQYTSIHNFTCYEWVKIVVVWIWNTAHELMCFNTLPSWRNSSLRIDLRALKPRSSFYSFSTPGYWGFLTSHPIAPATKSPPWWKYPPCTVSSNKPLLLSNSFAM